MTDGTGHSLLSQPLLRVRGPDGEARLLTLPAVLAGLSQGDVVSFEALQSHQKQAWFCFLVQLAAIALSRADRQELPEDREVWRELLLDLTDGEEAAWCLVADDVSRPAFMQTPVPEGSLEKARYRTEVHTPDELDVLVTSKNHDVKMLRVSHPEPQHWVYALVNLQTTEGFSGKYNYGIARMNSGYGSRPLVGASPGVDWPGRFRRDVEVVNWAQRDLAVQYGYDPRGPALLWRLPWDGTQAAALPLEDCNPLFIEVCRRIRMVRSDGALRCLRATTKATRIAADADLKGVTGDPWTPVNTAETKALTIGERGFHYDLLQRILLAQEYRRPAALRMTNRERNGAYLVATALARGQGETKGFHHRVVQVPDIAAQWMDDRSRRQDLARLSQERVELAANVQRRVLRPALLALLASGRQSGPAGRSNPKLSQMAQRWLAAFDASVDDVFFPELWASLDLPPEQADRLWQQQLRDYAREQLEDAIASTPIASIHRYRAVSAAESLFNARARQELDALYARTEEQHEQL